MLSAYGSGFVIGLIMSVILRYLNIEQESITMVNTIVGGIFGIIVGIFFIKKTIGNNEESKGNLEGGCKTMVVVGLESPFVRLCGWGCAWRFRRGYFRIFE